MEVDKEKLQKVKDQLYKIEDITELGIQLPLVAFPQLQNHVETLDRNDFLIEIQRNEVVAFINENLQDFEMKDERALSRAFKRLKKQSPDRLYRYRNPMLKDREKVLKYLFDA